MLVLVKFLKRMVNEVEVESVDDEPSVKDLLTEHLKESIAENSCEHIDTDTATKGARNILLLSKSLESLEKAEAERLKVQLQIDEIKQQNAINWNVLMPKIVGIGATMAVTIFWLCMEQGTPVPMRLVKMATDLTTPRL